MTMQQRKRIGRYELREKIGSGSMSEVYRAYDPMTKTDVALKVLQPHLAQDKGFVTRFRHEAEVTLPLLHPHIIQIYEYGHHSGGYYIAMQYVPGGTLKDLLNRRGPLSPAEAVALLAPIANALYEAHQIPLVHRDVKSSNILIDEWSNPILTDFGIAWIQDGGETITGPLLGTPNYMSPEQITGDPVSWAADIYSLGVVLFESVTGVLPFTGEILAVMHQHAYTVPPAPRSINPAIPSKLELVILKALEKEPKNRFASAHEMAEAMRDALIEPTSETSETSENFLTRTFRSILARFRAEPEQDEESAHSKDQDTSFEDSVAEATGAPEVEPTIPEDPEDTLFEGSVTEVASVPEVEPTISEDILSRLSPSLQEVLLWAEGLRQALKVPVISSMHLLAALYQNRVEPVPQLLTLFDDEATIQEEIVDATTVTSVRFTDIRPAPADRLSALHLSENTKKVFPNALALADQKGSPIIHSWHLLAGFLAVPKGFAGPWIAETLGVERETLYQLISEAPDEALPLDKIRRASTRAPDPDTIGREEALARLEFIKSDLLDLQVDAYVNLTNTDLAFGGPINQQIIKVNSHKVMSEYNIEYTEKQIEIISKMSAAAFVPFINIVHSFHRLELLIQGAKAALAKAESLGDVRTIAFPSLGTGWIGFNPVNVAPRVLETVVNYLEQGSHLEKVIFAFVDEEAYQAYLNAYQTLYHSQEPTKNSYQLTFTSFADQVAVGQRISLEVTLQPTASDKNTFELPPNIAEVYCFVTANGFQVSETDAISIPLNPVTGEFAPATFELQAHLVGKRSYIVELFIEDPESGRIQIFKTSGHVTVIAPEGREPRSLLPTLDIPVAPPPDLVLQVASYQADEDRRHLTYYLSSRLPDLQVKNKKVGGVVLHSGDLVRIRALLSDRLAQANEVPPEDAREEWLAFGTYLFDLLFPPDETTAFRKLFWKAAERVSTLLIIEDGVSWLPWEVVVPYDDEDDESRLEFLGEQYQLCRWVEGLGPPRYHEIPFGEVALAHYKQLATGQGEQDAELLAWRRLLNASGAYGISQVVKSETPVYGIHLLLHTDQVMNQREIVLREQDVAPNTTSLAEELPRARLDLRLKRPVITLSMLDSPTRSNDFSRSGPGTTGTTKVVTTSDEWWLPERVLPFLRAGASAVVAPGWPTSEEADKIFWATFHELLARRVRLGEAVWRARLAVKRALPQRADWLAYTAFGDPRARPYWPEESEGYTVLECLNPEAPLQVGKTYYFRASIRSRPPIWHQDRLIKPTMEASAPMRRAVFLVPDFEPPIRQTIEMTPLGRTMVQATIEITPPEEGEFLLIARLFEGRDMLQSLPLEFWVGESGG